MPSFRRRWGTWQSSCTCSWPTLWSAGMPRPLLLHATNKVGQPLCWAIDLLLVFPVYISIYLSYALQTLQWQNRLSWSNSSWKRNCKSIGNHNYTQFYCICAYIIACSCLHTIYFRSCQFRAVQMAFVIFGLQISCSEINWAWSRCSHVETLNIVSRNFVVFFLNFFMLLLTTHSLVA